MKRVAYCFVDVVSHEPVYLWLDAFGRYWLAGTRWSLFRVASIHGPEIWQPASDKPEAKGGDK
jgi:hypothetical protein